MQRGIANTASAADSVVPLILQFLHERGYTESLACLQSESGFVYEPVAFERGGELLHIFSEYGSNSNHSKLVRRCLLLSRQAAFRPRSKSCCRLLRLKCTPIPLQKPFRCTRQMCWLCASRRIRVGVCWHRPLPIGT